MVTILESIATGTPPLRLSQEEAAAKVQKIESLPASIRRRLPQIYENSGIHYRYSCMEDYGREPSRFEFYPRNWRLEPAPSTAKRNQKYRLSIIPLVERVARDALNQINLSPGEITHLITVSCTGFFAPGFDIHLIKQLGLPPDTARTMIGFMGCYAAITAIRMAHTICQAHQEARVLLVCAELCTLHFQIDNTLQTAVANAIFSDGAAAAIFSSRSETEAKNKLSCLGGYSLLDENSMDDMSWDIGDTGFIMGLSPRVPQTIAPQLPNYVDTLLARAGLERDQVNFWAIHPGGREIVEKAQQVLNLGKKDVLDSLEVLRLYGNMSSPTILFVLERILDRFEKSQSQRRTNSCGVAIAFGPGLTFEGCVFKGC